MTIDSKAIVIGWTFDTKTGQTDAGTLCTTDSATAAIAPNQTVSLWKTCRQKETIVSPLHVVDVQIDFSKLVKPFYPTRHPVGSLSGGARAFLVLRSGLDLQDEAVYTDLTPLRLFPGTHQSSIVERSIQRRLKSPSFGILGFEVSGHADQRYCMC